MNLLDRIWNWLTSSGGRTPRKSHPDLYPIDIERIAKDLCLDEEAKLLGMAGLPAPEAAVISGPEAAVVQRVEKARQDYMDWGALRLNVLNTDLRRRDITKDVNRARQADQEFERKASALLAEQEAIVRGLGEVARKRKEELEAFRVKHHLMREAHFPTGTRSYFLYSLLLALVALEGILNAKFFAQGLDSGLLGGFLEAGIMATINVFIAFMIGKFAIPYANHHHNFLKALGFLAVMIATLIMGGIGLGISHYRDSLTSEITNPAEAALTSFLAHPLHLKDFFSWALFAISFIFGLASLFEGLYSDDRYPGYGSISRRTQTAIDDHEFELNNVRATLEELKDEELESLDATLKHVQTNIAILEEMIQNKHMAGSRLAMALLDSDNSLDALLKRFRSKNELHRNGVKRPAYFDTLPDLRPIQPPNFDTASDDATLQAQKNMASTLLTEEQGIRARIQAAFIQQFDHLKPLDYHFPSEDAT